MGAANIADILHNFPQYSKGKLAAVCSEWRQAVIAYENTWARPGAPLGNYELARRPRWPRRVPRRMRWPALTFVLPYLDNLAPLLQTCRGLYYTPARVVYHAMRDSYKSIGYDRIVEITLSNSIAHEDSILLLSKRQTLSCVKIANLEQDKAHCEFAAAMLRNLTMCGSPHIWLVRYSINRQESYNMRLSYKKIKHILERFEKRYPEEYKLFVDLYNYDFLVFAHLSNLAIRKYADLAKRILVVIGNHVKKQFLEDYDD